MTNTTKKDTPIRESISSDKYAVMSLAKDIVARWAKNLSKRIKSENYYNVWARDIGQERFCRIEIECEEEYKLIKPPVYENPKSMGWIIIYFSPNESLKFKIFSIGNDLVMCLDIKKLMGYEINKTRVAQKNNEIQNSIDRSSHTIELKPYLKDSELEKIVRGKYGEIIDRAVKDIRSIGSTDLGSKSKEIEDIFDKVPDGFVPIVVIKKGIEPHYVVLKSNGKGILLKEYREVYPSEVELSVGHMIRNMYTSTWRKLYTLPKYEIRIPDGDKTAAIITFGGNSMNEV